MITNICRCDYKYVQVFIECQINLTHIKVFPAYAESSSPDLNCLKAPALTPVVSFIKSMSYDQFPLNDAP